jgi:mannose-6-phosphate isomerase
LQLSVLAREVSILSDRPNPQGLQEFFRTLMTRDAERSRQVVEGVLEAVKNSPAHSLEAAWMVRLQEHFPGDIGVLSPLFLNLVQLKSGEALYLPAGELHAYLEGVGIELMANSDNVLRGGLTPKYIDTGELLRILDFESREVEILTPTRLPSGEKRYPSPAEEFSLAVIVVTASDSFTSAKDHSVEIMICTQGSARIRALSTGRTLDLNEGSSALVPAAAEQYRIEGEATLYRAGVPL